ncbi:MAG: hypothetical protein HN350_07915 [Phycisphaerales bacterium]|nr:hypothetical protein [Phycisphaerales bacterium]
MACPVADIFKQAAELNLSDPRRQGGVVTLESPSHVICSGDIHGYRLALNKIISHANLGANPNAHVILQEILHGPPDERTGQDRSIEQLMRAARLKIEFPQQVLLLMGNHDLAQVAGSEISKYGHGVCKAFISGVEFAFPNDSEEVLEALDEYFFSMPLAVRCPNGVLISHSLPSPNKCDDETFDILNRPITRDDLPRHAPAYNWVWGRRHTEEQLETLAEKLDVEFFLLAHQHTEAGYDIISRRGAVVLSDHANGYVVEFGDHDKLSGDSLKQYMKPLATL